MAWRRVFLILGLLAAATYGAVVSSQESDDVTPADPPSGADAVVLVAPITGVIGPASTRFVEMSVAEAEARDADLLVLQLDTPGGLVTSTREINEAIIASQVPVAGYVAPSGGHAASAGTFILYATHIAAMAPGTNIGAATPIQMGAPGMPGMPGESPAPEPADEPAPGDDGTPEGDETSDAEDAAGANDNEEGAPQETENAGDRAEPAPPPPGDAASAKAVNDAVAYIRSLAELRGRNADWAEQAVRGAGAITPSEALELNVIEIIADDMEDLLAQLDGRSIEIDGDTRTLIVAGAAAETLEPSFMTRVLGVLANPNVAFIFMLVGVYGLIFELAQPGSIGPGVIGVISLIIGLYALNQLPLNYAGAALIVIGLAFMVVEAFSPSFGVFGLGGLVAFLVGAAMLIDTEVPEYRLSWGVIAAMGATSAAMLIIALSAVVRGVRGSAAAGAHRWLGAPVTVSDWSDGRGHVFVEGERWAFTSPTPFTAGDTGYVAGADGLTLQLSADPPKGRAKKSRDGGAVSG